MLTQTREREREKVSEGDKSTDIDTIHSKIIYIPWGLSTLGK